VLFKLKLKLVEPATLGLGYTLIPEVSLFTSSTDKTVPTELVAWNTSLVLKSWINTTTSQSCNSSMLFSVARLMMFALVPSNGNLTTPGTIQVIVGNTFALPFVTEPKAVPLASGSIFFNTWWNSVSPFDLTFLTVFFSRIATNTFMLGLLKSDNGVTLTSTTTFLKLMVWVASILM